MYTYVIVDDEPIAQKGLLQKMAASGLPFACVGTAGNGAEGYRLIVEKSPHLAIIDMNMPHTNGAALLELLGEGKMSVQTIITSGYSDFEYAKKAIRYDAIDYLLKPFSCEELTESLKKAMHTFSQERSDGRLHEELDLIKACLNGEGPHKAPVFSALPLPTDAGVWEVAELYGQGKHDTTIRAINSLADLPFAFIRAFSVLENERAFRIAACRQSGTEGNAFARLLRPLAEREALTGGISLPCDIEHLYDAAMQARNARKRIPARSGEWLRRFDPDETRKKIYFALDTNRFIYLLECGEEKRLQLFFEEMWRKAAQRNASLDALEGMVCQLFESASDYFIRKHPQKRLPTEYLLANLLRDCVDEQALANKATDFFAAAFRLPEKRSIGGSPFFEIRDYIDTHFTEQISLYHISEVFALNPSYISQLFSEKGGTTYKKYITQLRMEKAKALLVEQNLPLKKIAQAIGMDNIKYFLGAFKKATGQTPTAYRQRHCARS